MERSKPRKKLEYKRNAEKLEDDPEVTRVFDKKLIKRWGFKPVDIVTEFTYMEVVDTGTHFNEAWVSIHTDDLDSVSTITRKYSTTFSKKPMMNGKPVMLKKHFVGQSCHPENKCP